jgi:hypothetical protein
LAEYQREVHRAKDRDLRPLEACRLLRLFGQHCLRFDTALLPGDRHCVSDLRPGATADGNSALGERLSEPMVQQMHSSRRGGE